MLYFVLYERQTDTSMNYMQYPALLFLLAALNFQYNKETFELLDDHSRHFPLEIWGGDNWERSIFIEPAFIQPAFIQDKGTDRMGSIEDDDGGTSDQSWAGNSSSKPPLDPSTEPPKRARFPQLWSTAGESRKKKKKLDELRPEDLDLIQKQRRDFRKEIIIQSLIRDIQTKRCEVFPQNIKMVDIEESDSYLSNKKIIVP